MADALRMRASVDDQASRPLENIRKKIKEVGAQPGLKDLSKNLDGLKTGFGTLSRAADAGTTSLLGMSMQALSLTGVVAGLGAAAKAFAGQSRDLATFSRQTGMSAQTLQQYGLALKKMGLDADEAQGSIETLHAKAYRFGRGLGGSDFRYDGKFASDIKAAAGDAQKELRAAFEAMGRLNSQGARQDFAEKYLGDPKLAAVHSWKEFSSAWQAAARDPAMLNAAQIAKGDAFSKSLGKIEDSLAGLRNSLGADVADKIGPALDGLAEFMDKHQGGITTGLEAVAGGVTTLTTAAVGLKAVGSLSRSLTNLGFLGRAGLLGAGALIAGEQFGAGDAKYRAAHPHGDAPAVTGRGAAALGRPGRKRDPWAPYQPGAADAPDIRNDGPINQRRPPRSLVHLRALQDSNPFGLLNAGKSGKDITPESLGDSIGKAMATPGGAADAIGKESGKSFGEMLKSLFISDAHAGELPDSLKGALGRVSSVSNGGLAIAGTPAGAGGRTRHRVGGAGIPINQPVPPPNLRGSSAELVAYIRSSAIAHGIDPNVALRVARGEGGLSNPFRHGEGPAPRSQDPRFGSRENSYGPYQLYVSGTGAGLGDRALKAGIDPRTNWKGGIDFALDEVRRKGWSQWYGARAAGITGMRGVGDLPESPIHRAARVQHPHTVTPATAMGHVTLHVTAPAGTKVSHNVDGDLFQKVTINRTRMIAGASFA